MISSYMEQELPWKYPTLDTSQASKVWWQAYLSLVTISSAPSETFKVLKHEFDVELDLSSAYQISDEALALRVSRYLRQPTLFDNDKPVPVCKVC